MQNKKAIHKAKVEQLQETIRNLKKGSSPLAFHYHAGHSNTTRTKSYKQKCSILEFGKLNEIIEIDPEKKVAIVEPRVTMEALLRATLPYHLIPAIIPEFKGITVGGAIMGGAAESSSHRWGCFHDSCPSHEILGGDGALYKVSSNQDPDLYYGISSSYGSLGALVSTEIQLLPASEYIYLHYHSFSNPFEAIEKMKSFYHSSHPPDFIDGIIFNQKLAVIIEGHLQPQQKEKNYSPSSFSLRSSSSQWFYQYVKKRAVESKRESFKEKMNLEDYFFRYDLGAFWMGAYLFNPSFLKRFLFQAIWKIQTSVKEGFTEKEISHLYPIPYPSTIGRTLSRPLLDSQNLWKLLHRAEHWIQNRAIIQDFCIPESKASDFCREILANPAVFPIWLCPIKGTRTPQIFSPHLLSENLKDTHFINFGIYGIPAIPDSISSLTKILEQKTDAYGGRKVLYSRSYYTSKEFWQIYSYDSYEKLRKKMHAHGVLHEIEDKVLSS